MRNKRKECYIIWVIPDISKFSNLSLLAELQDSLKQEVLEEEKKEGKLS